MGLKYNNLINLVIDDNNLRQAYKQARKNKRYKKDVLIFKERLEYNLQQIKTEILEKTYKIGNYINFIIYKPKERNISALPFRDRVVQHALCNIIEPIFNRYMFSCSYACRKGKETHRCMFAARNTIQSVYKNKPLYFLKMDFRKFFPSIDRSILYQEIYRKIKDKHIIWLLNQIIPPTGTGLPIGNLTSQLFANVYGTIFDRYVKQVLRVKYYIRYMDDSVIFSGDKYYLKLIQKNLNNFIKSKMNLNFSKWFVENINKGLNFIGYRIFRNYTLIRKSSVIACKRKIKRYLYKEEYDKLYLSLISWSGHIKWADTYNLRKYIRKIINSMPNELGYITQYDLLHSEGDLWKMSAVAAMRLADNIKNESPSTDHHEMRMSWAGQILNNADQWVNSNKWNIIQNPTLLASGHNSTDTDVEYVIAGLVPV